MHAYLTLGAAALILDIFDGLLEFGRTDAVLGDDIVHPVAVVVLLRQLGVGRVGSLSVVQQYLTAGITGRLEGAFQQVDETDMNYREFKLDMTEMTRAFIVLIPAGLTADTRFDNSHSRIH